MFRCQQRERERERERVSEEENSIYKQMKDNHVKHFVVVISAACAVSATQYACC